VERSGEDVQKRGFVIKMGNLNTACVSHRIYE
jgi:hypothetical protein